MKKNFIEPKLELLEIEDIIVTSPTEIPSDANGGGYGDDF